MNNDYQDIRSRINEEPKWFDENAVPRYCEFHPNGCANIYATQAALVLIKCQACGKEFKVAISCFDQIQTATGVPTTFELIKNKSIHYGDPPNVRCCPAGPTMNCIDMRVLEAWERPNFRKWERNPEYEIEIEGDDEG